MGDKAGHIRAALDKLAGLDETNVLARSPLYRTEPVGYTDQDWFVNAAALLETGLAPQRLVRALLEIEAELGRVREERWGPRVIDLDLLFYEQQVIDEAELQLPHPRLHERRFVLTPLADVAPDWLHPLLNMTPGRMLESLPEEGQGVLRL